MRRELHDYDIYPKVFPVQQPVEITIRPLGCHVEFAEDTYTITLHRLDIGSKAGSLGTSEEERNLRLEVHPSTDGKLRFVMTADKECEHYIRIWNPDGTRRVQLSVYALEQDLAERIPLRGDTHMHTCRSDGREDPAIVVANYRSVGYDFMAITDHFLYEPSLEAIEKYKEVPINLNLIPGEEVHDPLTNVHIVNFGGKYSVNDLWRKDEQHESRIRKLAESLDLPEGVDAISYAACLWVYEQIRKAEGLSIFAHPYWIADMWHVAEPFTNYMMKEHPFDAFEVLGGENYYQQNGYQTALYYEEWKAGRIHPVVGGSDSHGSTEHNGNRTVCSTIVFAHENEREDIIRSVKDRYSVAVDTISSEYRLVGEFRYQKYASFLMEQWYPIHDSLCEVEGKFMKEWYLSDDKDASGLIYMKSKMEKLFRKYFRMRCK